MSQEITTTELAKLLEEGQPINLIDVREIDEWQSGHIAQAKLIPLSEFTDRMHEIDTDNSPIYVICRSGGRSGKVCDYLAPQGYKVVNVQGGMLSWAGDVVTGD
ncbi:rhodanese-related sulfurtransferase [Paenibacillus phyllosphaerae]|uniref:Rhodanese-related sulfurtransferase n=1 Tax=Paenibacillus phyllosphaerae TaxID=274593 RepID=A0A7W5FLX8_9BACL|nr:rhodanese-like domain-containing protein [Paenibacillus phyllosphaerae]MBB3109482.1 rhodanese-related sulfurtransferase [Paenibacillus phyllosphaerae]